MCILFIYTNPNPEEGTYRLIIASNRDEYYKRPAKRAFLCNETNIIGGRDMERTREGGMWLGATVKRNANTEKVCFGALLNVSGEISKPGAIGRGFIVVDYLKSTDNLEEYLDSLNSINHNSYNFVAVEVSKDEAKIAHHSNAPISREIYTGKQILGFGNSPLKSPLTKVKNGTEMFKKIINKNLKEKDLIEELLKLLRCSERHLPDLELEKRRPGVHEYISSIFVQIEEGGYGTRTHSILLVDYDWNISFIEYTMKEPIVDVKNAEWEVTEIKSHL